MARTRTTSLEKITQAYWEVGTALRAPQPPRELNVMEAFELLNLADYLRPSDWRLTDLMHVIKYDIIEGNNKWRANPQVVNSALILHMKDWIFTAPTSVDSSKMVMQ